MSERDIHDDEVVRLLPCYERYCSDESVDPHDRSCPAHYRSAVAAKLQEGAKREAKARDYWLTDLRISDASLEAASQERDDLRQQLEAATKKAADWHQAFQEAINREHELRREVERLRKLNDDQRISDAAFYSKYWSKVEAERDQLRAEIAALKAELASLSKTSADRS